MRRLDVTILRLAVAGLLATMAWIHLHLWDLGYRHIHLIGPMFLANFVAAVAVGAAALLLPGWLAGVAGGAGVLLAGGTLIGLAVTINVGLFGFRDSMRAPYAGLSVVIEVLAALFSLALTFRTLKR